MSEFDFTVPAPAGADLVPDAVTETPVSEPRSADAAAPESAPRPVDPVRSAAGRLGSQRVQRLAELGREYEREHGLTAGRQRRRQLIQLGRRYEAEHGLRVVKTTKRRKGDAWRDFLVALSRVVKPVHRPAIEQLVAGLRQKPTENAA